MRFTAKFLCLVLILSLCGSALAVDKTSASLEARRKQLNDLLKEQWEYTLRTNPEFATILGDKRYNDQVSDASEKEVYHDLGEAKKFLARFEAVDTTGFPEQEALNKALMIRGLKQQLGNAKFESWLMPVTQFYGIHIDIPQLVSLLPFDTVKDYEDYIARLKKFPKQYDDTIDLMRKGKAKKLMPPKILLDLAVGQTERIAAKKPEETPFAVPLKKFPKEISEADQKRLREGVLAAIQDSMLPAYQRMAKFLKEDYAPFGRTEPGLWSLPDGDARYAARVKNNTTTDMTPEEVHQLGLREVARIEAEMLKVAQKLGYSDLKTFKEAVANNPDLHPKSRQEMLDLYQKYIDQMYEQIPKLFGRLPKAKVRIEPVPEFREKEDSGASYNQGTPDGKRPGQILVNTGDFAKRTTVNIETTAYHEGVPGHHMQISIAQELPELPPFRQQLFFTAYVEGWALYSERLGEEVGFFKDPYSYYGHLTDEMLRAVRLAVDTGFHYKRWTRRQVVDFFHEHSGADEVEVQSETDRYIAIPGQALGYKIGQLKILELREKAHKALGDKFDIRAFHDEVLGGGALPMDVLEQRIDAWVARVKAGKAAD
ncbi:MAG: DUF885 domain-containing protein [Acidobacteriales bacterium]|nr:DUF885 domain-containing protein [Terriglobales bacterium]